MSDDFRVCGFAQHEMDLLSAGDGNRELGRLRRALAELSRRVEAGEDEARRGEAMYEISEAYEGMKDHERALDWFDRALVVREFRDSSAWAHRCHSAALRFLWRKDFERAEALAREAVSLARARRAGSGEDWLIGALVTYAEALLGVSKPLDVLSAIGEARQLFLQSEWLQKFRPGYAVDMPRLEGRAWAALRRFPEALRALDEAEASSADELWSTRDDRRDILLTSAAVRREQGQHEEALKRVQLACDSWNQLIALRKKHGAEAAELQAAEAARDALSSAWGLGIRLNIR